MVDFARLAQTAQRLIEANGRSVMLRKRDRTPADPAEPWRGPDTTPTPPDGDVQTAIVAFVPPSGTGFGRNRIIDGTLADSFDQIGLLAADSVPGIDIEDFSTVEDGTKAWKIENVKTLRPADQTIIYALSLTG